MARKRHNPKEIKFCQSTLHKKKPDFNPGDIACLVKTSPNDSGNEVKIVVCQDCFKKGNYELVEEIKVEEAK